MKRSEFEAAISGGLQLVASLWDKYHIEEAAEALEKITKAANNYWCLPGSAFDDDHAPEAMEDEK